MSEATPKKHKSMVYGQKTLKTPVGALIVSQMHEPQDSGFGPRRSVGLGWRGDEHLANGNEALYEAIQAESLACAKVLWSDKTEEQLQAMIDNGDIRSLIRPGKDGDGLCCFPKIKDPKTAPLCVKRAEDGTVSKVAEEDIKETFDVGCKASVALTVYASNSPAGKIIGGYVKTVCRVGDAEPYEEDQEQAEADAQALFSDTAPAIEPGELV